MINSFSNYQNVKPAGLCANKSLSSMYFVLLQFSRALKAEQQENHNEIKLLVKGIFLMIFPKM